MAERFVHFTKKVKHLTLQTISRYHQGALTHEEVKQVQAHVARCSCCRPRLDGNQLAQVMGLYAPFDSTDVMRDEEPEDILDYPGRHVAYSWCEQYVYGTLNGSRQELVRSHCMECSVCAAVLSDLMNLNRSLGSVKAAPATGKRPLKVDRSNFGWRRLLWKRRQRSPLTRRQEMGIPLRAWGSLGLAGVALVCVLIFTQQNASRLARSFDGAASIDPVSAEDVRLALATGKLPIPEAVQRLSGADSALNPTTSPAPDRASPSKGVVIFQPMRAHKLPIVTARPIYPVATAVRFDRPILRWSAALGCSGYRISLISLQKPGKTVPPAFTVVVPRNVTAWQTPVGLARDTAYSWSVTPLISANYPRDKTLFVPVTSRFRILSESDVALSAYAAQQYATTDPVRLGVVYARLGLLADANEQFKRYLSTNPQTAKRETVEKFFQDLTSYTSAQ